MKVAILKQREAGEKRVAIHPEIVKQMVTKNINVCIESGAGEAANISDEAFIAAGAKISRVPLEILADCDALLKVQVTDCNKDFKELEFMRKDSAIIGLFDPANNQNLINKMHDKSINCFAMEMLPRISRAQSMDVLSSQSNLAGYRAVIDSAYHISKVFPMLMTAAGTIFPAKVLVLGVGVAGLQAIATAKRLGASVFAFDVRKETKEQVESLGGTFIEVQAEEEGGTKEGYAKEMTDDYKRKQAQLIEAKIAEVDIVITTALIPGKQSPILVTKQMVEKMKPGSVIYDLAAVGGGNCELTQKGEITEFHGVRIIGFTNILSEVANEASRLYAKNLFNFLAVLSGGEYNGIKVNMDDELVAKTLIAKNR